MKRRNLTFGAWGLTMALTAVPALAGESSRPAAPPLRSAHWIWDAGDDGSSKSHVCHLRKTFELAGTPIAGTAAITADNNCELTINGVSVGSDIGLADAHWRNVRRYEIGRHLRSGPNSIVVRGVNGGGPGGVVAAFRIEVEGRRRPTSIVTDESWEVLTLGTDQTACFEDGEWKPARVVGRMGIPPWGMLSAGEVARRSLPEPIRLGLEEPPTRTLGAEEARGLLEDDWLHQAEDAPLDRRAIEEIGWAREAAARLAEKTSPPDLRPELEELNLLEREIGALPEEPDEAEAEALYFRVRDAKRRILFKDPAVDFSSVIFIDVPERYPHESMHRVYPQAQLDCVRLLVLDGLHPGGAVRRLAEDLGPGWYWRPDVSFDGRRILFCFRPAGDRTFHLYEVAADGTGLRQITSGGYDDQDPIYLPDGRIAFVSNRGNSYARCTVGHPSTVVSRCDPDGSNIYIISAGNEPEYTPALMPDGRILYTRWEYTDKELMRIQSLWTMNPDGTDVNVFWGNQSYWPDLLMEARPIPGSRRTMFAAHGHHEVYWGGIGILDPTRGYNYPDGLTKVTQELPWIEVGDGPDERMESRSYHTSGSYGGYKSPCPLGDDVFLVSARRGPPDRVFETRLDASPFELFLMDVHGNRELIWSGTHHVLYAMPLRPRARPPVIPDRVEWAGSQEDGAPIRPGVFYSADILRGTPPEVRERARYLRVIRMDHVTFTLGKKLQDVEHPDGHPHMHVGPVMSITVNDGVKRVLGTVPIEPDGSVSFEVPPLAPLHFQLLDERHLALHTMRSFTSVMPGERRGCLGCHETHAAAPPRTRASFDRAPAEITPYPWGAEYSFGYERDIQPILDGACGSCHQGEGEGRGKLDLTLRPSADCGTFPEPYVTLTLGARRGRGGDFPSDCEGGIAGTILAQALPWRPQDYRVQPPLEKLSAASPLIELASSGKHHDVRVDPTSLLKLICWVDTLCPYRGEKEVRDMADPDPAHPLFRRSDYPPADITVEDVYRDSPYRPRMRTAPLVERAYRQDEFPTVESRLRREARGEIPSPVVSQP